MFEFIQVHLDCKDGCHGFDRTPEAIVLFYHLDSPQDISKPKLPKSGRGIKKNDNLHQKKLISIKKYKLGRKEGSKEGRKEGRKEARKEGRQEGSKEGRKETS